MLASLNPWTPSRTCSEGPLIPTGARRGAGQLGSELGCHGEAKRTKETAEALHKLQEADQRRAQTETPPPARGVPPAEVFPHAAVILLPLADQLLPLGLDAGRRRACLAGAVCLWNSEQTMSLLNMADE